MPSDSIKINALHYTKHTGVRSGGTGSIKYIVVHYTACKAPAKNFCVSFNNSDRTASADWIIGDEGIWEYNNPDDGRYTYHCGDGQGKYGITNNNSVGIEVVSEGEDYTASQLKYLTSLVQHLMSKYKVKANNVVRHYDASRKACPVMYCPPKDPNGVKWAKVWQTITKSSGLPIVSTSSSSSNSTSSQPIDQATAYAYAINHGVLFDRSDTKPYLATIDVNTSTVDYKALKKAEVVGIFIDMGSYFNSSHKVKDNFRQSKFISQVELATSNNFPYGLFTTIGARTTLEAELELQQIRLAVKKYPPDLGVWLKLDQLQKNKKSLNDIIINYYRDKLILWGLKGQIGFYATREDLDKISWNVHRDYFYWWMIRHMKKLDSLEKGVPDPKFFAYKNPIDELLIPDFESAEHVGETTSDSGSSTNETLSGNSNAEKIWNWCIAEGMSKQAAAAVIGNVMQESSTECNPSLHQKGGPGRGLFQWEEGSDRFNNLCKLAKQRGVDWTDMATQLQFFKNEVASCFKSYTGKTYTYSNGTVTWWPKKVSYNEWKKWTNIIDATDCLERVYMRPATPMRENRRKYAQQAFNTFGK